MKLIVYLIILAGLAYGGKWVYDNYLAESVNEAMHKTGNFVAKQNLEHIEIHSDGTYIEKELQ